MWVLPAGAVDNACTGADRADLARSHTPITSDIARHLHGRTRREVAGEVKVSAQLRRNGAGRASHDRVRAIEARERARNPELVPLALE